MLPRYTNQILVEANEVAKKGAAEEVYGILRGLTLADFCTLHMGVPSELEALKQVLPLIPPPEVQKKWVGDSGQSLMNRSCNVMRLIETMSWRTTGLAPQGKNILDYGCGWGRLLRLANYFSPVENVFGLDVMQSSLDECKKAGIHNKVELVAPAPDYLPFGGTVFDIIFSFSVFTHIPERVARAVLHVTRSRIADNGVFILTIRSHEFWNLRRSKWPGEMIDRLQNEHEADGYAFQTFNAEEVNADYGDTTMSFDFLRRLGKECRWEVASIDRDLSEPFQIAVALRPV